MQQFFFVYLLDSGINLKHWDWETEGLRKKNNVK